MKKLITFLLITCMTVTLLTGCKKEPEKTNTTTDDKKVLEISYANMLDVPAADDAPIIKKIEELYKIKLNYINVDRSKYNEMLGLKISSGEIPDAFMLDGNMLLYSKFQNQGVLKEIPLDILKKHAPKLYKAQEPYLKYLYIEDKLYGLTGEKLNNKYPLSIVWRKDWLTKVGIEKVPETLAEAEKALYAFVNDDPDGNGKKDTYGLGKSGLDMIFGAYGGIPWGPWPQYWLWQQDGKGGLQNAAVLPGMKDALKLLQKWYKDGILDKEYILGENKGGYWANSTDFFNNKIGLTGLGQFYHWVPSLYEGHTGGQVYAEFKKLNPKAEIAFGKPVKGPEGKAGTWVYPVGVGAAGMFVFGNKITEEKQIRLLKMFEDSYTNNDSALLFAYGTEGTHWIKDSTSNSVLRTEKYSKRTDYLREGVGAALHMISMEFEKQVNPKLYEWADKTHNFKGYENELLVSLPTEAKVRPDLEKLRDQYYTEIIVGKKSVDAFDEFVKQWNSLGGEQLKKEADEWYKKLKK